MLMFRNLKTIYHSSEKAVDGPDKLRPSVTYDKRPLYDTHGWVPVAIDFSNHALVIRQFVSLIRCEPLPAISIHLPVREHFNSVCVIGLLDELLTLLDRFGCPNELYLAVYKHYLPHFSRSPWDFLICASKRRDANLARLSIAAMGLGLIAGLSKVRTRQKRRDAADSIGRACRSMICSVSTRNGALPL